MAKKGMRRPDCNGITHFLKNDAVPVPEIQDKAKTVQKKADPMPQR